MKVLITNYRGFEIHFDAEYEKFQCVITEDSTKESTSFSAVKGFIDEYIKNNIGFKPFYIEKKPLSYGSGYEMLLVVGIRKDGRFVVKDGESNRQLAGHSEGDYVLFDIDNAPMFGRIATLEKRRDAVIKAVNQERLKVISKMKFTSLSSYRETLL